MSFNNNDSKSNDLPCKYQAKLPGYRDVYHSHQVLESEYTSVQPPAINYPSCYRQNILIMLAKKLMKEETDRVNACKHINHFHARRQRLTSS